MERQRSWAALASQAIHHHLMNPVLRVRGGAWAMRVAFAISA
jgi:hypothetical protein